VQKEILTKDKTGTTNFAVYNVDLALLARDRFGNRVADTFA